VNKQLFIYIRR